MTIRIGLIGTSWWADSMYLPAIAAHPDAEVVGLCGRRLHKAEALAASWNIPWATDDVDELIDPHRVIDEGYIGRPHHLNLCYFTGYGRDPGYDWRFDTEIAGSGSLGDLGSHWLHIARWLLGEVTEIGCVSNRSYDRPDRPDGSDYDRSEDSAIITVRFESGAYGMLQVSAVCWEGTDLGQTHHLDLHGTAGTVYSLNDWAGTQTVSGVRSGEPGPARPLPIPDDIWGGARRDRVHDTYRDMFRVNRVMIGDWIDAIASGRPCEPDLAEGARVQRLIDLAQRSAALDGRLLDARR